jgi:hypothetical protein
MKVDTRTGRIEFERGVLERGTEKARFLQSRLGTDAAILIKNGQHLTYGIRPEQGISATVLFEGSVLKTVTWQIELALEKERVWSVENELERKRVHDSWLAAAIGMPPYEYAWGRLESDYDSKGCASSIIVSYAD